MQKILLALCWGSKYPVQLDLLHFQKISCSYRCCYRRSTVLPTGVVQILFRCTHCQVFLVTENRWLLSCSARQVGGKVSAFIWSILNAKALRPVYSTQNPSGTTLLRHRKQLLRLHFLLFLTVKFTFRIVEKKVWFRSPRYFKVHIRNERDCMTDSCNTTKHKENDRIGHEPNSNR